MTLMPDPTEMVITCGFAAALGIFVIAAVIRLALARRSVDLPADWIAHDHASQDRSLFHASGGELDRTAAPPGLPVGRVPVWFYRPYDLVGAGFVFLVFCGLVLASFRITDDARGEVDSAGLLVSIGFQFVMGGVVAMLVVMRVGWNSWLGLKWPSWQWVFAIAPCAVLFMWAVVGGLQISGYVKWMESFGVETVQDTVQLLQKAEDPVILGLMGFAAMIAAPLCEEVVFRGYFYPVLKKFGGAWPAAICSALLFACAHGNLAVLLPLFIFGGVLVFIYEKTGSLWAPIAVHFCFNSATVVIQMVVRQFPHLLETSP